MTEQELFNTPQAKAQAAKSKKRALQSIAELKPSEEVYAVVNGLEMLTAETITILTQRAMAWFDRWPLGEPRYSRNDGYQFVIHTNQIMEMLGCSISKAQDMLRDTRMTLGKKDKNAYISVKEFCWMFEYDEEDFRRALRDIKPDWKIK